MKDISNIPLYLPSPHTE